MILFFKSFLDTFMTLSWIDLVFFIAVLFLIILIVSLIYFIMINNETEDTSKTKVKAEPKQEVNKNVSIFEYQDDPNEEGELLDLKTISKRIKEKESSNINLTDYEEEQEQKAIISYDELIAKKKDYKINYEEEENLGDLTVKKVDLDNLNEPIIEEKEQPVPVRVISYEKEEAFLEALKKLQEQTN